MSLLVAASALTVFTSVLGSIVLLSVTRVASLSDDRTIGAPLHLNDHV